MNDVEIAREIGHPYPQTICMWRHRHGLPANTPHRASKVKPHADKVLVLRKSGMRYRDIADEINVSYAAIQRFFQKKECTRRGRKKKSTANKLDNNSVRVTRVTHRESIRAKRFNKSFTFPLFDIHEDGFHVGLNHVVQFQKCFSSENLTIQSRLSTCKKTVSVNTLLVGVFL